MIWKRKNNDHSWDGPTGPGRFSRSEQAHVTRSAILMTLLVAVMNIADALLTLFWISKGMAKEANPIMDALIQESPWLFLAGKGLLIVVGLALLLRFCRSYLAVGGLLLAFGVYAGIMTWHFTGFLLDNVR